MQSLKSQANSRLIKIYFILTKKCIVRCF